MTFEMPTIPVVAKTDVVVTPVKRGRGRPKKVRTPEELAKLNAPKRPRGRPRKNPVPAPETLDTT